MDGGKWDLMHWSDDNGQDLDIPKPITGNNILLASKFDLHSGNLIK